MSSKIIGLVLIGIFILSCTYLSWNSDNILMKQMSLKRFDVDSENSSMNDNSYLNKSETLVIDIIESPSSNYQYLVTDDVCQLDCGVQGECVYSVKTNTSRCRCSKQWTSRDGLECNYYQRSQLVGFLLSFFVGYLGVDWFYLARGNGWYICAGVFKILTLSACGIWWLVDWIRMVADAFPDGNGVSLFSW